jgi:anti-anti-sigma factor
MMGATLTVSTRLDDAGGVELVAAGELDLSTVDRFRGALEAALAAAGPGRAAKLDLRGVEYLDSAAINILFAHASQISLVRVHPLMLRGLTISGIDQLLEVRSAEPD